MNFGDNIAFSEIQSSYFIFAFSNNSQILFQNISLNDIYVEFIFYCKNTDIVIMSLSCKSLIGSFIDAEKGNVTLYDLISYETVSDIKPMFTFNSLNFSICNGSFSNLNMSSIFFLITTSNGNLTLLEFYKLTLNSNTFFLNLIGPCDILMDKISISLILGLDWFLISQDTTPPTILRIKDSRFNEIFFNSVTKDSWSHLISFFNITVERSIFVNIDSLSSVFFGSLGCNLPITFFANGNYFANLTATSIGPIMFLSSADIMITFEDSLFEGIVNGFSSFLPSTQKNTTYVFKKLIFLDMSFEMGFVLLVLATHHLTIENCMFASFNYNFPSVYRGIIKSISGYVAINSTVFSNINITEGDANLIHSINSDIPITNCIFQEIAIQGAGGIYFTENSRFRFISSVYRDSNNLNEGIFQLTNLNSIEIKFSTFSNITSYKYALFFIQNFLNINVSFCNFSNIVVNLESTAFWIDNQNLGNNFSTINFSYNLFENNTALSSFGGGLSFRNCPFPIYIENSICIKDLY